jgi:D-inositol-3-phosphate glycosyltransferase
VGLFFAESFNNVNQNNSRTSSQMTKRIACFTAYTAPGEEIAGAEGFCQPAIIELMSQVAEGNFAIDLYCAVCKTFELQVIEPGAGIRVIQIPVNTEGGILQSTKPQGGYVQGIQNFIASDGVQYDLIYSAQLSSAAAAMAIKDLYKIPLVFALPDQEHASWFNGASGLHTGIPKLQQQIVRRADLFIVENQQTKAELVKEHAASFKKIFVVPGGIVPELFNPENKLAAREKLHWEAKGQVLLHVAGRNDYAGVDNIIKAMALLDAANGRIRLVIINDRIGPDYPQDMTEQTRLESMAQDLGMSRQVSFLTLNGPAVLKDYYTASDILVTTPANKSEGVRAIEAMACGTPVIASEGQAMNLGVLDGKTGFLVPTKAAEVLADRIGLILGNEALLDQMRRNSVKHIRENFSWEQVADQVKDLFEYVMLTKGKKQLSAQTKTRGSVNRNNPSRSLTLKRTILARYGNS